MRLILGLSAIFLGLCFGLWYCLNVPNTLITP